MTSDVEQRDTQTACRALVGRRITGVRYMTADEAEPLGGATGRWSLTSTTGLQCSPSPTRP